MKNLILVMIIALIPTGAFAGQNSSLGCGPHQDIASHLAKEYGQYLVGFGIAGTVVLEFYKSKKDTWSMVTVDPEGIACMRAIGPEWNEVTPEYKKPNETDS